MKRLLAMLCALLLLGATALAQEGYLDLAPGVYEVGRDIPAGKYDIRFNGLEESVTISFSFALDADGLPDLTNERSFSLTFTSLSGWWNAGGFLVTLFPGYLQIENSGCRLWAEE